MSAPRSTELLSTTSTPTAGKFEFRIIKLLSTYDIQSSPVEYVTTRIVAFRSDFDSINRFVQNVPKFLNVVQSIASIQPHGDYATEISAYLASFFFVKDMALDFCKVAGDLCVLFSTVQDDVRNASVADLPTKAEDLKKIDEMIKSECIGGKIGDVLKFVSSLDGKFQNKFGLQEIKYLDLFRDSNFLKYLLKDDVLNANSTAIDTALYNRLPKSPKRVWRYERFSVFACNCKEFSSEDAMHVHCVYLPKSVNYQIALDQTNVFAIECDSVLLQVQAMGWLDLTYCIKPKNKFNFDDILDPILKHLAAIMAYTANLIGTLLCSPCSMYSRLLGIWRLICKNSVQFTQEACSGVEIKHTKLYKNIIVEAFHVEFFETQFLKDFLDLRIEKSNIKSAAKRHFRDITGLNVFEDDGSFFDETALTLICVVYICDKFKGISFDLEVFLKHCVNHSKTVLSNWIREFDDAGISKLVSSVGAVFHIPAAFHEPYMKNTYDESNGARNMFEGYVNYVHTTTKDNPETYAPYFPIVQSSGYGKTRLVRELMNTMPVYYVCLRPPGVSGSPPRSPVIAEHFTDWASTTLDYAWIIMRILFHHLKSAVGNDLWVSENSTTMYHKQGLLSFQTDKKVGETDVCGGFWDGVFEDVKLEYLENFAKSLILPTEFANLTQNYSFKHLHSALEKDTFLKMQPDQKDTAIKTLQYLATSVSEGYNTRFAFINPLKEPRKILPLVLAVDEVSNLLPPEVRSQRIPNQIGLKNLMKTSKFYFFRQACAIFRSTMVFTVLDTLAGLWLYAPPNKLNPSFRILEANFKVFHPFIRLPFPRNLVLPNVFQLNTDSVTDKNLELQFKCNRFDMAIQSRPLYFGYIYDRRNGIKAAIKNEDTVDKVPYVDAWEFIASIAYYKLIGVMLLSDMKFDLASCTRDSPQYLTLISLFAARFGVIPKEEVYKQALINANAATLLNLSDDREYADVSYVMEPMIGEAAASVMNMPDTSDNLCDISGNPPPYKLRLFDRAFDLVCREALAGTLGAITNDGFFAEVIAAVLLARAFDCANEYPYPHYKSIEELLKAQKNGNGSQHTSNQSTSTVVVSDIEDSAEIRSYLFKNEPKIQNKFDSFKISGSPVTVYSWLMHLLSSGSDNIPKRFPVKELHKMPKIFTGWLRILQFCQPKHKQLNRLSLAVYFTHYSAVTCAKYTEGFDLIVSVYLDTDLRMKSSEPTTYNSLKDLIENFKISNSMSGIFVQVKAHREPVSRNKHAKFVTHLLRKARDMVPTGPICTIIMYMYEGLSHCKFSKNDPSNAPKPHSLHYSTVCTTEAEIFNDFIHSQYCECRFASLTSQASHQPHDPSSTQSMNIETEKFNTSQTVVSEEVNPGEGKPTEMEITDTEMNVINQEQTSSVLETSNISDEEKSNLARLSELRDLIAKEVRETLSKIDLNEVVHITCSGLSSKTYNTILDEKAWAFAGDVIGKDLNFSFEYRNAKDMYLTSPGKMSEIIESHNPANKTTDLNDAAETMKYLLKFKSESV